MLQKLKHDFYYTNLISHYEKYFGNSGVKLTLNEGPMEKLDQDFHIREFEISRSEEPYYCYCTVGMSVGRIDDNLIELFVYSPKSDLALVELLTVCASYHKNVLPLNLNHTVNIGQSWIDNSICDHGFISLPYLDGEKLELTGDVHCYWFIPITIEERDFKIANGSEALEQLFEDQVLDYINPMRQSLV